MTAIRIGVIAAAVVVSIGFASVRAQQTGRASQPPPIVGVVGCVDRLLPPAAPNATTDPAPVPPPRYKLVDVQPGPSPDPRQPPIVPGLEYEIVGPATMEFSKYQNQWVELTGTIGLPAPAAAKSAAGRGQPRPLPVLTVLTLKVVTNECK
jgi:hypothetical protein